MAILMTYGLMNKEIAKALVVSERTVDSHVRMILAKLGVGSRFGAACKILLACPEVRQYDVRRD